MKIIFFGSGAGFRRVLDFIVQAEMDFLAFELDVCLPFSSAFIPADAGHAAGIGSPVRMPDRAEPGAIHTVCQQPAGVGGAAAGGRIA